MTETKPPKGPGDGNATLPSAKPPADRQPPPLPPQDRRTSEGGGGVAPPRADASGSAYSSASQPTAPAPDAATALARAAARHVDPATASHRSWFDGLFSGQVMLADAESYLQSHFPHIPRDKFEWLLSLKGRGDIKSGASLLEMFQQYDFACKTESEVPAFADHVPPGEIPTLTREEEEFFLTHRMFNFTLYAARRALALQAAWKRNQQGRNWDEGTSVFAPGGTHRFVQAILLTDATTVVIVDPEESLPFKMERLRAIGADEIDLNKTGERLEVTFVYRGQKRKIVQYMHDVFDADFWPRELEKGIDAYYEVFFRASLMMNGYASHYERYNAQVLASLNPGALLLGDDSIAHLTRFPNPFTGDPSLEEHALGLERFITPHPTFRPGMSDFPTYAAVARDPIPKERVSHLSAAFRRVTEATYELMREIFLKKEDVELKGDGYHLTTVGEETIRGKIVAGLKAIDLGLKELTGEEIDSVLEWIEKDHPTWFPRSMGVFLSDDGFRDIRRQSEPLRKRAQEILKSELPELHEALTGYSFEGSAKPRIRKNAPANLVEKATGEKSADDMLIIVHPLKQAPQGALLTQRGQWLVRNAEAAGIATVLLKSHPNRTDWDHPATVQLPSGLGEFKPDFVVKRATFIGGNVFGCLMRAVWSVASKDYEAGGQEFTARIVADSSWQSRAGIADIFQDILKRKTPEEVEDYLRDEMHWRYFSPPDATTASGRSSLTIILHYRGHDYTIAKKSSGPVLRIEIVEKGDGLYSQSGNADEPVRRPKGVRITSRLPQAAPAEPRGASAPGAIAQRLVFGGPADAGMTPVELETEISRHFDRAVQITLSVARRSLERGVATPVFLSAVRFTFYSALEELGLKLREAGVAPDELANDRLEEPVRRAREALRKGLGDLALPLLTRDLRGHLEILDLTEEWLNEAGIGAPSKVDESDPDNRGPGLQSWVRERKCEVERTVKLRLRLGELLWEEVDQEIASGAARTESEALRGLVMTTARQLGAVRTRTARLMTNLSADWDEATALFKNTPKDDFRYWFSLFTLQVEARVRWEVASLHRDKDFPKNLNAGMVEAVIEERIQRFWDAVILQLDPKVVSAFHLEKTPPILDWVAMRAEYGPDMAKYLVSENRPDFLFETRLIREYRETRRKEKQKLKGIIVRWLKSRLDQELSAAGAPGDGVFEAAVAQRYEAKIIPENLGVDLLLIHWRENPPVNLDMNPLTPYLISRYGLSAEHVRKLIDENLIRTVEKKFGSAPLVWKALEQAEGLFTERDKKKEEGLYREVAFMLGRRLSVPLAEDLGILYTAVDLRRLARRMTVIGATEVRGETEKAFSAVRYSLNLIRDDFERGRYLARRVGRIGEYAPHLGAYVLAYADYHDLLRDSLTAESAHDLEAALETTQIPLSRYQDPHLQAVWLTLDEFRKIKIATVLREAGHSRQVQEIGESETTRADAAFLNRLIGRPDVRWHHVLRNYANLLLYSNPRVRKEDLRIIEGEALDIFLDCGVPRLEKAARDFKTAQELERTIAQAKPWRKPVRRGPAGLRPEGFRDYREFAAATGLQWRPAPVIARSEAILRSRSGQAPQSPAYTRGIATLPSVARNDKQALRTQLISEARERGYPEVARILARLNDDQTVRLVARVADWRKILERKGEGSMVPVVKSWSRTEQTLLTLAVLLNRKADVERVTKAFRDPSPGNRPAALPPAMVLPLGAGQALPVLR